jgi:hypothetical protein
MKAIEAVSIWVNGQVKQANTLNVYVVNDDLKSSCTFFYALLLKTEQPVVQIPPVEGEEVVVPEPIYNYESLTQGNVQMSGEDYISWNNHSDINGAAYEWVAGQLGLTLTLE